MNTTTAAGEKKVARVAIDVRLYFDVPIVTEDDGSIQRLAREELERVASTFRICQICSAADANSDTRFAL